MLVFIMPDRFEEKRKMLINERDQLLKLKKENRARMDTQAREENELVKACLPNPLTRPYHLRVPN